MSRTDRAPVMPVVISVEFVVTGVVQGVGFRWFARREARNLGLTGWVRNRADGTVQVLARGNERAVARFEELLRQGPRSAVVEQVTRSTTSYNENYQSFEVTG